VGPEPSNETLTVLLERHNFDVAAAANAYFDGARGRGPAAGEPIDGTPVPEAGLFEVTVPEGMAAGQELRVETDNGPMRVVIPAGLVARGVFLVRPPARRAQQATIPQARPVGGRPQVAYPGQAAYPGLNHQPGVALRQQQPVYVRPCPRYGGYYGGYDPFLASGMGLLGGMLIADALFW